MNVSVLCKLLFILRPDVVRSTSELGKGEWNRSGGNFLELTFLATDRLQRERQTCISEILHDTWHYRLNSVSWRFMTFPVPLWISTGSRFVIRRRKSSRLNFLVSSRFLAGTLILAYHQCTSWCSLCQTIYIFADCEQFLPTWRYFLLLHNLNDCTFPCLSLLKVSPLHSSRWLQ